MRDNRDNFSEQNLDKLSRDISILRVLVVFLIIAVIVGGFGAGYCGYKLYRKVQGQTDTIELSRVKINTLEIRMEELSPSLDDEAKTFLANCDDDHYNILFIGNSITRHEITSY